MMFWNKKTVAITGGQGLLGTPLVSLLKKAGATVYAPTRAEVDWENWEQTKAFFAKHNCESVSKIDCVFHLAAKVGGVNGNTKFVGDYFSQNMVMNNNVLKACMLEDINRVVSVLSTCVYPDAPYVQYPLTEDQLHNGPPHESNFGYAYAKRMLDVQSRAYREQYSHCDYITVIPNNLFGENDNFDLEHGHVVPSLIRKIYEAKMSKAPQVEIWGDAKPLREFTYATDAAKLLMLLGESYHDKDPVNIGTTKEYSIGYVAASIKQILGYEGELTCNTNKPVGQYRKASSNAKLLSMTSWTDSHYTNFNTALENTCKWFVDKYPIGIRGV